MKNKVMEIVTKMCNTQSTNCRSLNKADLAKELLTIANVPESAMIQEIPVDWNNQVIVLFLLPNDNNYYSLFAGIGNDGNFYFELTITGVLNGNEFDFFDTEKDIDIDYFLTVNKEEITTVEETKKYYNPCNLHLSGREYVVLEKLADGKKVIMFPTFANKTITAYPNDLDNSKKAACERKWKEERNRVAKIHGWKNNIDSYK